MTAVSISSFVVSLFHSPVIVCVIVDVADDDAVSVAVDIDVVAVIDDVPVDTS